MTMIADNLQSVRTRVQAACRACGRDPAEVALLAVSKTFGPEAVHSAHAAGQTAFGENYIQEATRLVAEHFDWAHTVDRLKIAQRLSEQRPAHRAPLQVCLQVNIDGGPTKSGVAPSDALTLAREVAQLPNLVLRGLMTIPEPAPDFAKALAVHRQARALFDELCAAGMALDTLSMGMTADLEAAVHAGSTMVRVGTAIFGGRAPAAAPG